MLFPTRANNFPELISDADCPVKLLTRYQTQYPPPREYCVVNANVVVNVVVVDQVAAPEEAVQAGGFQVGLSQTRQPELKPLECLSHAR
jgi:hypothetical protein